jgi:hypothetical protein
MSVTDHYANMF